MEMDRSTHYKNHARVEAKVWMFMFRAQKEAQRGFRTAISSKECYQTKKDNGSWWIGGESANKHCDQGGKICRQALILSKKHVIWWILEKDFIFSLIFMNLKFERIWDDKIQTLHKLVIKVLISYQKSLINMRCAYLVKILGSDMDCIHSINKTQCSNTSFPTPVFSTPMKFTWLRKTWYQETWPSPYDQEI